MCLSCNKEFGAHGREEIAKLFSCGHCRFCDTTLHTHDNKEINCSDEQLSEIINNALVVIATGVDSCVDIWAIQWKNDYKVRTF